MLNVVAVRVPGHIICRCWHAAQLTVLIQLPCGFPALPCPLLQWWWSTFFPTPTPACRPAWRRTGMSPRRRGEGRKAAAVDAAAGAAAATAPSRMCGTRCATPGTLWPPALTVSGSRPHPPACVPVHVCTLRGLSPSLPIRQGSWRNPQLPPCPPPHPCLTRALPAWPI